VRLDQYKLFTSEQVIQQITYLSSTL